MDVLHGKEKDDRGLELTNTVMIRWAFERLESYVEYGTLYEDGIEAIAVMSGLRSEGDSLDGHARALTVELIKVVSSEYGNNVKVDRVAEMLVGVMGSKNLEQNIEELMEIAKEENEVEMWQVASVVDSLTRMTGDKKLVASVVDKFTEVADKMVEDGAIDLEDGAENKAIVSLAGLEAIVGQEGMDDARRKWLGNVLESGEWELIKGTSELASEVDFRVVFEKDVSVNIRDYEYNRAEFGLIYAMIVGDVSVIEKLGSGILERVPTTDSWGRVAEVLILKALPSMAKMSGSVDKEKKQSKILDKALVVVRCHGDYFSDRNMNSEEVFSGIELVASARDGKDYLQRGMALQLMDEMGLGKVDGHNWSGIASTIRSKNEDSPGKDDASRGLALLQMANRSDEGKRRMIQEEDGEFVWMKVAGAQFEQEAQRSALLMAAAEFYEDKGQMVKDIYDTGHYEWLGWLVDKKFEDKERDLSQVEKLQERVNTLMADMVDPAKFGEEEEKELVKLLRESRVLDDETNVVWENFQRRNTLILIKNEITPLSLKKEMSENMVYPNKHEMSREQMRLILDDVPEGESLERVGKWLVDSYATDGYGRFAKGEFGEWVEDREGRIPKDEVDWMLAIGVLRMNGKEMLKLGLSDLSIFGEIIKSISLNKTFYIDELGKKMCQVFGFMQ